MPRNLWPGFDSQWPDKMKLISLNIWGGKIFQPLMEFIANESADTDIFCFQEVWDTSTNETTVDETRVNILRELTIVLPNFSPYFAPMQDGFTIYGPTNLTVSFGNAIFVRRKYAVTEYGAKFVYKTSNAATPELRTFPRALQHIKLQLKNYPLTIYNFHGLVPKVAMNPKGPNNRDPKIDTPERLDQSSRIRHILNEDLKAKILCGDFNLRPDTESMKIVAGNDLKNLITTYDITDTRGPLLQKPVRHADQMLVSPEIQVTDFAVPSVAISDHLPLILSFTFSSASA